MRLFFFKCADSRLHQIFDFRENEHHMVESEKRIQTIMSVCLDGEGLKRLDAFEFKQVGVNV